VRQLSEKLNNQKDIMPARVKEARLSRGLSLAELADRIGISSQAISQYELGISRPSPQVLEKMSEELQFPINFFSKPMFSQQSSNSPVNFRSLKSSSKKTKDALEYRISWLHEINLLLRKYINFPDFPEIDLPKLNYSNDFEIDFDTIEDVALNLRKHWNIEKSPIPNLVELLQEKGFIISRIEFGEQKIDAFSQWFNNYPYIILGSDKSSATRSRFDLAHELGHLILHVHIDPEMMMKKNVFDRLEKEANYFAGAFLLPRDSFPQEVLYKTIDHFIILKKRWKVSIQAMIKRCESLYILNESQVRYLFAQIAQRGYRKKEPLDDLIPLETPYLLKQAIKLLLDNQIIKPEEIVYEIARNKEEIDSLCFLPDDLLKVKPRRPQLTLISSKQTNHLDKEANVMKKEEIINEMTEWFFENYEDPANGVPYDGREGGYQYINGGPFDPQEILSEQFPEYEEFIDEATSQIYPQGDEWVKKGDY